VDRPEPEVADVIAFRDEPEAEGTPQSYTQLQEHYLQRLIRLIKLREACMSDPAFNSGWVIRLCNRGMYSTFRDCEDQGIGGEALALIRGELLGIIGCTTAQ